MLWDWYDGELGWLYVYYAKKENGEAKVCEIEVGRIPEGLADKYSKQIQQAVGSLLPDCRTTRHAEPNFAVLRIFSSDEPVLLAQIVSKIHTKPRQGENITRIERDDDSAIKRAFLIALEEVEKNEHCCFSMMSEIERAKGRISSNESLQDFRELFELTMGSNTTDELENMRTFFEPTEAAEAVDSPIEAAEAVGADSTTEPTMSTTEPAEVVETPTEEGVEADQNTEPEASIAEPTETAKKSKKPPLYHKLCDEEKIKVAMAISWIILENRSISKSEIRQKLNARNLCYVGINGLVKTALYVLVENVRAFVKKRGRALDESEAKTMVACKEVVDYKKTLRNVYTYSNSDMMETLPDNDTY